MLVKFTTKSYPDIVMFGQVAKNLLKMAGHSATVPSAIVATEVADYHQRLIDALARLDEDEASANKQTDDEDEPVISLHLRAQPLVELLEAAIESNNDVMWQEG